MDVKHFFRKRLTAYFAVIVLMGLCGAIPVLAVPNQNYQVVADPISGNADVTDYGIDAEHEDNGYIATFRTAAGGVVTGINGWTVTNNPTANQYEGQHGGVVDYNGTYRYFRWENPADPDDVLLISLNPKLVIIPPTASVEDTRSIKFSGKNTFGIGLNYGDWSNYFVGENGRDFECLPVLAQEVDVVLGVLNDNNLQDEYNGIPGAKVNVTFTDGSETRFWGGVQFGGQDGSKGAQDNATVTFQTGSKTTFENQNTYFGAGGWIKDATGEYTTQDGGGTIVKFEDGSETTFNQRAVFGGGTDYVTGTAKGDWVHVGNSDITFEGGTTTFNGTNATKYKNMLVPTIGVQDVYNQKNYYGVYFSAIGGNEGLAIGGTANVHIVSGTNTFNTEVHSAGNYDFTPYGDIIRSKDDFDVTWGGTSNFLIEGGDNQFNGRSTFGAPNGTSVMNINGGRTFFGGKITIDDATGKGTVHSVRSANMGKGDILDDASYSTVDTNYNGQDSPYVFFGGKTLTEEDVNYWNNYYAPKDHTAFEMSVNDFDMSYYTPATVDLRNRTKVVLNTTGFVGGANYKLLNGSDDIGARGATEFIDDDFKTNVLDKHNTYTDSLYKEFTYGDEGAETQRDSKFTVDYTRFNTNANTDDTKIGDYVDGKVDNQPGLYNHQLIKQDNGGGTFNVHAGAEFRLGLYNNTQLYNGPDQYLDNLLDPVQTLNPGYTTNRNAQVQLLGEHATFTADAGSILYFTIDPNGTTCKNAAGEDVERLNVGRIAFEQINISKDTKLYLSANDRGTLCNQLIGQDGKDKEFYSIEAFHDTDGTNLNIDQDIKDFGGKHLFYEVGVEKLAKADDGTPYPDQPLDDHARLHITYHDPHSVVADGNLGINMNNYLHELCYQQEDDYQEALEDIWNSDDKIEAQEKFDDLAGGIYGDWLNAQVQRNIAFNNMLANRLVTDDMGLCQFCCQSGCAEYASDCEPGCYQCCARRQCEFGGRICGKYPRYCEPRRSIWGSFLGNYGNGLYWNGFTKYHEESSGMAVGIEWKNVCCRVFGLYFGFSNSDIWHGHYGNSPWRVGDTYSRVKSDDYTVGLYAKWDANCLGGYWLANGSFTYNTLDAERYYITQSYDNNFEADTKGLSAAAYVERGWMYVECHGFVINPYISAQYTFARIDDFTETGTANCFGVVDDSNMNLYAYDMAYHSLRGQLGVRVSRDFIVGCNNWQILRLTLGAAYAHEFLDPQAIYYTHVMGSKSMDPESEYGDFEMRSNGCSRNWANLMFSADYRLTQRMSANFQYNAYFNQYKTVNGLNATLRIDF